MIYLLPFIAAAVGWFTNYIAVKMLFRPQRPIKIGFFSIQGVFPKNQKMVAERIGNMIAEELLSSEDIKDRLAGDDNLDYIKKALEKKIDNYLNVTFPKEYPITSVFFGQKRKDKIKDDLVLQVEQSAPDLIDDYLHKLEQEFNVQEIIQERVENLSPARLERLIMGILKKELAFIEWVGALIGFVIGIIQVVLVSI